MKKPKVFLPVEDLPGEIWKPIPGFSRYMASNKGRIKSLEIVVGPGRIGYPKPESIAKQTCLRGYMKVPLTSDSKIRKHFFVHILIATVFGGPKPDGHEINHIDSDKSNNCIENLEWVTHRENMMHAKKRKPKTSKYSGVSARKDGREKKWRATVVVNKKQIIIGSFYTELEASQAFQNFCKEHNIQNKYA